MGRPPPVIPAEKKARIVLSVIAGELSVAEAARREKVSEQSIGFGRPTSWRPVRPRWRPGGPVRRRVRNSSRPSRRPDPRAG